MDIFNQVSRHRAFVTSASLDSSFAGLLVHAMGSLSEINTELSAAWNEVPSLLCIFLHPVEEFWTLCEQIFYSILFLFTVSIVVKGLVHVPSSSARSTMTWKNSCALHD